MDAPLARVGVVKAQRLTADVKVALGAIKAPATASQDGRFLPGFYLGADPEDVRILDGGDDRQRAELLAQRLKYWKSGVVGRSIPAT
jgi:hypothetical protein